MNQKDGQEIRLRRRQRKGKGDEREGFEKGLVKRREKGIEEKEGIRD